MNNSAKSGLFLIEMIIAIAFFSLAAAICTSLFVRAHVVSEGTREANMAVLAAQSVAECFKATGGSAAQTAARFSTQEEGGSFSFWLDRSWSLSGSGEQAYLLRVAIDESVDLRVADIEVLAAKGSAMVPIYTLQAKQYNAGEG